MILNEKDHINYAKNELRNYEFLNNVIQGLDIRIDELITEIDAYKSSPVEFNEGSSGDPYWKNTLRDKLSSLEEKKEMFVKRLNNIDCYFSSLNKCDCLLIKNLYIEGKTFLQESQRLSTTIRSLERHVERLMLKFEF